MVNLIFLNIQLRSGFYYYSFICTQEESFYISLFIRPQKEWMNREIAKANDQIMI